MDKEEKLNNIAEMEECGAHELTTMIIHFGDYKKLVSDSIELESIKKQLHDLKGRLCIMLGEEV